MDFNHTPTFLRSTILEDPFCLGDLIGPEDVLRIQSEFPELFGNSMSKNLDGSVSFPKKTIGTLAPISARLVRLSQPPNACDRARCKPPSPVKPPPPSKLRISSGISSFSVPLVHSQSAPNQSDKLQTVKVFKTPSAPTLVRKSGLVPHLRTGVRTRARIISTKNPATEKSDRKKDFVILGPQNVTKSSSARSGINPRPAPYKDRHKEVQYKSGVLKPVPTIIRRKPSVVVKNILRELDEWKKSKMKIQTANVSKVEKIKKEKVFDRTVHIARKNALEKLDQFIFKLPKPIRPAIISEVKDSSNDELCETFDSNLHSESLTTEESHPPSGSGTKDLSTPQDVIQITSHNQRNAISPEEKEERLTRESMDRCEQLLLAKLLADKYEKEGKFKSPREEPQQPAIKKKVRINSAPQYPPSSIQFRLVDGLEAPSKAVEKLLRDKPKLVEKIARDLVHAEVLKILHEEVQAAKVKIATRDAAVEAKLNNGKLTTGTISIEDSSPSGLTNVTPPSQSVSTPTLTPPSLSKCKPVPTQVQKPRSIKSTNSNGSLGNSVRTPSMTPKLIEGPVANKEIRVLDATDCSELEDFVASELEPPERLATPKKIAQPCKVETSTPDVSTPVSSNSEQRIQSEQNSAIPEVQVMKKSDVGLQVLPEEFSGKSFDLSELESSLGSVLELISEGEFLQSEGKSPGEISAALTRNSPGRYHLCVDPTDSSALVAALK